jgi:hypothetical protein
MERTASPGLLRGRFGEHGRRAQGQIGDVGEETDAFGNGNERGDEGPGVKETPLIGMVLDAHEIEARPVGGPGDARRPVGRIRQRLHANAKLEIPAVVAHVVSFAVLLLRPSAATSEMRRARVRTKKASEYAAASSV